MILVAERRHAPLPTNKSSTEPKELFEVARDFLVAAVDSLDVCTDVIMRHIALEPDWVSNRTYTFYDHVSLIVVARARYHGGKKELRLHKYPQWVSHAESPRRKVAGQVVVRDLLDNGFAKSPTPHKGCRSYEKPVFLHKEWLPEVPLVGVESESVLDRRLHLLNRLTDLSDPFLVEMRLIYLEEFGVFRLCNASDPTTNEIEISLHWMGDGYDEFLESVGVTPEKRKALLAMTSEI